MEDVDRVHMSAGVGAGKPEAVFLLTAKDPLEAGAYEEMLRKNGLPVVVERCEPTGSNAYTAAGGRGTAPVNLYVAKDQCDRAHALVDAFENEPLIYNTPLPPLNQKSKANQILFAFCIFLVIILPIGAALFVLGTRAFRFFFPPP